jgi:uncharacterized repeat protein (TIGR02543 family)
MLAGSDYHFGEAETGYAAPPGALTVTVRNTGNTATGELTIGITGNGGNFDFPSFSTIASLGTENGSDSAAFAVRPKAGLGPNSGTDSETYTETVTVSGGNGINKSFTVSFTVKNFAVSFETGGGSPVPSLRYVSFGDKAARPATDPSRSNFTFTGWYDRQTGGSPFNFDAVISADTTVYARWQAILDNDYTLNALSVSYSQDAANLISDFGPAKTAYSFNVDSAARTVATINAVATLGTSQLLIIYGDTNADSSGDQTLSNGSTFNLPAGSGSKVLKIKVTAQNGNAQVYYVTINAYVVATKTYSGTVDYTGSGKTILSVAGRDADFATQVALGTTSWTLTVPLAYTPESFMVTMNDENYSYRSAAIYPPIISTGSIITLTVSDADIGRQVASAQDLAGFPNNSDTNYSLADDIDLDELSSWTGPTGYHGSFYGNGYTVKVTLKKNNGDTGLFTTLTNGALIDNLVVDVSTPSGGLSMIASSHFGALVGNLNSAGTYTIRNVTVNGSLNYSGVASNLYLLVGAIFGEVQDTATGINLTIDKCVSNLAISVQTGSTTRTEGALLGVGGLVGKLASYATGTVAINNCYTTGSITVRSESSGCYASAGGLVGNIGSSATTAALAGVSINNCYSTTGIDIHTTVSSSEQRAAGGLVGKIRQVGSGAGALTINNCFALNPRAISENTNAATAFSNRVIGYNERTNVPPTLNTYALKGMLVGTDADGTADDSTGSAADVAGEGKTAGTGTGELRNSTTWTGLGFTIDNWDFDNLATSWPTLK